MVQFISLKQLILDADVQPRETMSSGLITEYAKLYREGHELPPIKVFKDGHKYWVADGFHRSSAAKEAGLTEIPIEVQSGSKRDAILYACASNKHGKGRTNDDKRRAVNRLLKDREWKLWADREIARHCGVSHEFVSKQRRICQPLTDNRKTHRSNYIYTMDTSRIGEREVPPTAIEPQLEAIELPDDMDRHAIEAAFPEQPSAEIFDAFDGLDDEVPTEHEPEPERHIPSYVLWVHLLRQVATLLEQTHQMGGISAITKNLTPAQVEDVYGQVYRLDRHLRVLLDEVDGMAMIVDISGQSR
jgi:hypothetical protein